MPTSKSHINELISRYVNGQMTGEELEDFLEAVRGGAADHALNSVILDDLEQNRYTQLLSDEKLQELYERVRERTAPAPARVHRVHFLKTAWFKYAAAILLVLTGAITYYFFHTPQSQVEVAQTMPSPLTSKDVMPGSEKAILTLSNGERVQLNNATSETITDGTLSIKNTNGQLVYSASGTLSPAGREDPLEARTATNTMQTPRGGQYKLTLSDGTNVWLNAASSITYPIAFKGVTREVSITGEAYFEVKPNKKKPFIVRTVADEITVLGTSFNVNAYTDEAGVKTSLVEGIVKVGDTKIKPGQAYQNGTITTTNIQQDIAWKNGYFSFKDADIPTVMRQLSRWYDIDVSYRGNIPERKFNGEIWRSLTLSEVFKVLSVMRINYTVENKNKIIIHP